MPGQSSTRPHPRTPSQWKRARARRGGRRRRPSRAPVPFRSAMAPSAGRAPASANLLAATLQAPDGDRYRSHRLSDSDRSAAPHTARLTSPLPDRDREAGVVGAHGAIASWNDGGRLGLRRRRPRGRGCSRVPTRQFRSPRPGRPLARDEAAATRCSGESCDSSPCTPGGSLVSGHSQGVRCAAIA